MLARAGIADQVTIVRRDSSYNWYLREQIATASDAQERRRPRGRSGGEAAAPRSLAADGRPRWTYEDDRWILPSGDGRPLGPLSHSECSEPHLLAVFELIVKQHPSFTRFVREDAWYRWAQKRPGAARD